jgi:hypothetical protein
MKHYKDATNQIYAFASDGSQDAFIKPEFTLLSDAELAVLRAPTVEALAAQAQAVADQAAIASAKADAVIQYLVSHTPAECATYVTANVTNLATATALLQKFAMALCVLSKDKLK